MSCFFHTTLADSGFCLVEEYVVRPLLDNVCFKEGQSSILLCGLNNDDWLFFFLIFVLIFFPAIVPDIDEIAAQAETMFAGRYILWNFTSLHISVCSHWYFSWTLCLFCAYFRTPFSSFGCFLLHNLYIDRKVPEKIWISNRETAQLVWMAVGLEMTTLLVVSELVESFCHVPKGSWGMVYRCIGLKHSN